jgi:Undecaprenyl-phosphate glucose phosphotransferase
MAPLHDAHPTLTIDSLVPRRALPPIFSSITPVLALIDSAFIVMLSIACGVAHDFVVLGRVVNVNRYVGFGIAVAALFSTVAHARGVYSSLQIQRAGPQVHGSILIWLMVFLCLFIVAFALKVDSVPPFGAVLLFFVTGFAGITVLRHGAPQVLAHAPRPAMRPRRQVIVVAQYGPHVSPGLAQAIAVSGRTICKTISLPAMCDEQVLSERMGELITHVRQASVDEILLAVSCADEISIEAIVEHLRIVPVPVMLIPDVVVGALLERPFLALGNTRAIELQRTPLTRQELAAKRLLDILLSAFGLLVLFPVLGFTAALILLDSPGPILFRQRRAGFNGRPFDIYKLRTMRTQENGAVIRQVSRGDARITRVGRVLRKFSIDELPQLLNVLRGEMSLVGPRPHALAHDIEYGQAIAIYAARHRVKPGITGWAQVNGWRGATPQLEMMIRRVEHDLWYIEHWSLWLDIKILILTVIGAARAENAY